MSVFRSDKVLSLPEKDQNLLRVVYPGGSIARYLVSDCNLEQELRKWSTPLPLSGGIPRTTVIKLTYAQRVTILPFSTALAHYEARWASKHNTPAEFQELDTVFEALQVVYDALGF